MVCTGGVWLRRPASLGLGYGRKMLGEKPDDFRVVCTNFHCNFLSGFSLIKQGEDGILNLLGDGLHDEMAEAGGVSSLYLEPNWVWYDTIRLISCFI